MRKDSVRKNRSNRAKKWNGILAAVLLGAALLAGCGSQDTSQDASQDTSQERTEEDAKEKLSEEASSVQDAEEPLEQDAETLLSGKHHAEITVKDYGVIKVELDADTAPVTVTNFVNLAEEGFYDGLTFHRIIDGFMIQGGDPNGNGTGGSGKDIKGEFQANGVQNEISHVRGTISMARAQDYDSASSQFFIVQSDSPYLDGQYAGFGTVTEGMELVDRICQERPGTGSNGLVDVDLQPVIESIVITD